MNLINYFLSIKESEEKEQTTIDQYEAILKDFDGWNKKNHKSLRVVEEEDILKYMKWCKDVKNNGRTTRRKKLTVLKDFFSTLHRKGKIKINPVYDIRGIKIDRVLPKYLTKEEVELLINSFTGVNAERNKMICRLFIHTGLRVSELCWLSVDSIQGNKLNVVGKGSKGRSIPLSDFILEKLNIYIENESQTRDMSKPSSPLFVSAKGTRILKITIQKFMTKAQKKIGLTCQGCHVLRHTFATEMVRRYPNIRNVQELLGHENIGTTEKYTHVISEELVKHVNKNEMTY